MRRTDALRSALLAAACVLLAAACTIGHRRVGNDLRADPDAEIVVGRTTRGEVLRIFGPPDRLLRRPEGDAFLYTYEREESRSLQIREPIILRTDLYSWSESDSRSDRLLILFDDEGRVASYGIRKGAEELDR